MSSIYKNADKGHITGNDGYANFDIDNVSFDFKEVKAGSSGTAETINCYYRYPKKGKGVLYIQFHEVDTVRGAIVKPGENGKVDYKIGFILDPDNELDKKAIEILTQIEEKLFRQILKFCKKGDIKKIDPKSYDDVVKEMKYKLIIPLEGDPRRKVFWPKFMSIPYTDKQGKPQKMLARIFYDDDEEGDVELDWDDIVSKKFKSRPTVQIYRGYIGTAQSVQCTMVDALITSPLVDAPTTGNHHEQAKKERREKEPDLGSKIRASINRKRLGQDIKGISKTGKWDIQGIDEEKKEKNKKKANPYSDSSSDSGEEEDGKKLGNSSGEESVSSKTKKEKAKEFKTEINYEKEEVKENAKNIKESIKLAKEQAKQRKEKEKKNKGKTETNMDELKND